MDFGEKLQRSEQLHQFTMSRLIDRICHPIDRTLRGFRPSQLIILAIILHQAFRRVPSILRIVYKYGVLKGISRFLFPYIRLIPSVKARIEKEMNENRVKISESLLKDTKDTPKTLSIPHEGVAQEKLLGLLNEWKTTEDSRWRSGKVSGAVYFGDVDMHDFLGKVYGSFCLSNPLHPDLFPFVRKMEAEVISMTLRLFHGYENCCGVMTSGGTESILLACKAYRDFAADKRGITQPNMVVPITIHAAFEKAAHYFGIELIHAPVDQNTFRFTLQIAKRYVNRNTILIAGSSPCFPQGVIDDIAQLSEFAKSRGIGFHSDCCLGSFLLPFAERIGHRLPIYDFRNPGVSSISVDTHKYGYTPKGSSVILYSSEELRHYQYFVSPEWTGGLYATPGFAGSRPGALCAVTWATMVHIGENGYIRAARDILETVSEIKSGLAVVEDLEMIGEPDLSVICIGATKESGLNIYQVSEAMTKKSWSLNTLQNPPCFHLCCTNLHVGKAKLFLEDLVDSIRLVKAEPDKFSGGSVAIYGMAESLPDTSLIGDVAKIYIDTLYIP